MQTWKAFDADDQAAFAALSGDFNPMHMDAVRARRTQAGAPVVHGMHTLLWILDRVLSRGADLPAATSIKARFLKMVYLGERVDAEIVQSSPVALRARALAGGVEVLSLSLSFAPSKQTFQTLSAQTPVMAAPTVPLEPSLQSLQGQAGRLHHAGPAEAYRRLFPLVADYLGIERVAALGCTSCLVGMVAPGLHSVFGGVDLVLVDEMERHDELEYAVKMVDERFRLVSLAVRGGGLLGTVSSAYRMPPVRQPSMSALAGSVDRNEWHGVNALVIGGSRGIGEVVAKLIAAGGGNVSLTYSRGAAEAAEISREIRAWGGQCEIVSYDVREPAAPQLAQLTCAPHHVYYFATPMIAARKSGLCDPRRLDEFNAFYVTGFLQLVEACRRLRPDNVTFFYPSSIYVENRPAEMTEYAMSKAAGEVLCDDLQKYLTGVRVLRRRLPRLPSDQTSSLLPTETADPVAVMLPIIREMQLAGAAAAAR
jgi:NADP-dependent 3-hydroxy acid dehydrogenase YdfG